MFPELRCGGGSGGVGESHKTWCRQRSMSFPVGVSPVDTEGRSAGPGPQVPVQAGLVDAKLVNVKLGQSPGQRVDSFPRGGAQRAANPGGSPVSPRFRRAADRGRTRRPPHRGRKNSASPGRASSPRWARQPWEGANWCHAMCDPGMRGLGVRRRLQIAQKGNVMGSA